MARGTTPALGPFTDTGFYSLLATTDNTYMTSFDSYSNEPLGDSIPSKYVLNFFLAPYGELMCIFSTLPAIFSISELERHCTAYKNHAGKMTGSL
jgi:hypothetical protein